MIREFFWQEGFSETDTPVVVRLPGQEPYLNPVPVNLHGPKGDEHRFYLQTSPEFAMKKLLASGYEKIFNMCKCFRDHEDFGGAHNTEFTMIEWYRSPGKLAEIMNDTENLFHHIGLKLGISQIKYNNKTTDISAEWERITMKDLWAKNIGINLDDYLETQKMKELVKMRGYNAGDDDAYEDLFYKIFLNEIEPNLGVGRPVFVYDDPARMCSLSRLCKDDSGYAERFELYICGLELANAFGELTDADEQNKRLEQDQALRKKLGKDIWPVDPDFISALRSGIGEASGIALGADRMVLLFTGANDINEVIFGAVKDQIN